MKGAGTNERDPRQERGVSVVRECVAQFTPPLRLCGLAQVRIVVSAREEERKVLLAD